LAAELAETEHTRPKRLGFVNEKKPLWRAAQSLDRREE
jgi:hypothetical protein